MAIILDRKSEGWFLLINSRAETSAITSHHQQPQPAFPFFGVNSKTLEKSKENCHLENVIYTIQKHTLSLVHVRATD